MIALLYDRFDYEVLPRGYPIGRVIPDSLIWGEEVYYRDRDREKPEAPGVLVYVQSYPTEVITFTRPRSLTKIIYPPLP